MVRLVLPAEGHALVTFLTGPSSTYFIAPTGVDEKGSDIDPFKSRECLSDCAPKCLLHCWPVREGDILVIDVYVMITIS